MATPLNELVDMGMKLSFQGRGGLALNLDLAKSNHLAITGLSVGGSPCGLNAGCLFAYDTMRNRWDEEQKRFNIGLFAYPHLAKPATSPAFFDSFHFEESAREDFGLYVSVSAAKRLDHRTKAGISFGSDSRSGLGISAAASYVVDDEHRATVYLNHRLVFGVGFTRQIDAYYSASLNAFTGADGKIGLGVDIEYRPKPPMSVLLKEKLKELRYQSGNFQERLQNELSRVMDDLGIKKP